MARLTYKERKKLPDSAFALPKKRKYPIFDLSHARNALSKVSRFGSSPVKKKVRKKVHRKFPKIGSR